jgi:hypothetical protein
VDTRDELTHRAVRAAVAVARAHGLRVSGAEVLRDVSNALVHLRPAPVVARVTTTTALVRPEVADHVARDLAISDYLAGRGVAVVPLSDELPSGPHAHDGLVVSFRRYVEHDPAWTPAPPEFAARLAELHAELRDYPGELPERLPLDDVDRALGVLDDPESGLHAARDDLAARWAAHWSDPQPLHGDAHPGNMLLTPAGPLWNDFEDTWRGPVAWDLACTANTGRIDGTAAVAAHSRQPLPDELEFHRAVRRLQVRCWRLLIGRRRSPARACAPVQAPAGRTGAPAAPTSNPHPPPTRPA